MIIFRNFAKIISFYPRNNSAWIMFVWILFIFSRNDGETLNTASPRNFVNIGDYV